MTKQLNLAEAAYADSLEHVGKEVRLRHVIALGETGLFSKRQIAEIAGVPLHEVLPLVEKSSKGGGKINPAAIPLLAQAAATDDDDRRRELIFQAYELDTSANTIAMLLDMKLSQVWHRIRRQKRELEETNA